MFFRKDSELTSEVAQLRATVVYLNHELSSMTDKLEIQTLRIDALFKAYPHGINKDGSPRKKMGRKAKVEI